MIRASAPAALFPLIQGFQLRQICIELILGDSFASIQLLNSDLDRFVDLALPLFEALIGRRLFLMIHTVQLYRRIRLTVLIPIFVVLLGLAFGSFLNVCISRLPRHESIVRPRSRCPRCAAPIAAGDNIPILSWILLRGRCRHCNQSIAWRYPAVEFATAALFLLSLLFFGLTVAGIGMAILSFLLLGLAVMDAETMRLSDAFSLPGIALGILYRDRPSLFNLYPDAFARPWGIVSDSGFQGTRTWPFTDDSRSTHLRAWALSSPPCSCS